MAVRPRPERLRNPWFRGISHACPANEEGVYETPFTDIVLFDGAIHCTWKWNLTSGTTPTTYSPLESVTRAQKASFVARLVREAGIVWGTGAGTYSPSQK